MCVRAGHPPSDPARASPTARSRDGRSSSNSVLGTPHACGALNGCMQSGRIRGARTTARTRARKNWGHRDNDQSIRRALARRLSGRHGHRGARTAARGASHTPLRPQRGLVAAAARRRRARSRRRARRRDGRCRRLRCKAELLRAEPCRRLAVVARGPVRGPRDQHHAERVPDLHAGDGRWLPARAARFARALDAGARRHDRGRARGPAAGAAAHLAGRLRLSRLRPARHPARARSVLARSGASRLRPHLSLPRLAPSAPAVRPALHTHQLRVRTARHRRRDLGVQGARRAREPRCDLARRARGRAHGLLARVRGGLRRPEPRFARARRRRRPQRHARDAASERRARTDRRRRACRSIRAGGPRGARARTSRIVLAEAGAGRSGNARSRGGNQGSQPASCCRSYLRRPLRRVCASVGASE